MLLSVLLGAEPVFFLEHLGKSQLIVITYFFGDHIDRHILTCIRYSWGDMYIFFLKIAVR